MVHNKFHLLELFQLPWVGIPAPLRLASASCFFARAEADFCPLPPPIRYDKPEVAAKPAAGRYGCQAPETVPPGELERGALQIAWTQTGRRV